MKIGYIRVSTQEQNKSLQMDALKEAGCEKFFTDKSTGAKFERKGLEETLAFVRSGDSIVVWKLDRLGRSLKHLIELLKNLQERGIEFVSLTEQIDTTTPGGKLIFHSILTHEGSTYCCICRLRERSVKDVRFELVFPQRMTATIRTLLMIKYPA